MGQRVITLTTDFGSRDAYVATIKGVILSIAPIVTLVDITHEIGPQAVAEAAFVLAVSSPYFPAGTVHLAIVDPGVGTARRPIAVETASAIFVAPDNGVLAPSLAQQGAIDPRTGAVLEACAVELRNESYRLSPVSRTFHGRDVFAPAAAHLAVGVALSALGPRVSSVASLPATPVRTTERRVEGAVIHIDRFGNAITNIPGDLVPEDAVVHAGNICIEGLGTSYQEREFAALVGSSGCLEIARRNGSAAVELHLGVGDPVWVERRA